MSIQSCMTELHPGTRPWYAKQGGGVNISTLLFTYTIWNTLGRIMLLDWWIFEHQCCQQFQMQIRAAFRLSLVHFEMGSEACVIYAYVVTLIPQSLIRHMLLGSVENSLSLGCEELRVSTLVSFSFPMESFGFV